MLALTRRPAASITRCELTHREREPIDWRLCVDQHDRYEATLQSLGVRVEHLPEAPDHPDGVFVEDTAFVLPDLAVLCRPGADSRLGEVGDMEAALARHAGWLPRARIEAPGRIDGGDVLVAGKTIFIGETTRTNRQAIDQVRNLTRPFGYVVLAVPMSGCLHLKTAITALGDGRLLFNPAWVDGDLFARAGFELETVDPGEPFAGNVLRVGETVLMAAEHVRTAARLASRGVTVVTVSTSELAKAEAGLTCCSVLISPR